MTCCSKGTNSCFCTSFVHELIVVTTDTDTKAMFTANEWEEICSSNWTKLDDVDGAIKDYLRSFKNCTDAKAIHDALNASLPVNGVYDHQVHWAFHWIRSTITEWLGFYTADSFPMMKSDNLESFWRQDAYGMLNTMMLDTFNISVVHGGRESMMIHRNKRERSTSTEELSCSEVDSLFQVNRVPPENIGVVGVGPIDNRINMQDQDGFTRSIYDLRDLLCTRLSKLRVRTRKRFLRAVGIFISGKLGIEGFFIQGYR